MQAMPSSQPVGQAPSQVSLPSTRPLPQEAEQSLSVATLQPAGQQPSPWTQAVTGSYVQRALQLAAAPVIASRVQARPSLHEVGQLPSQTSPGSGVPLPQRGWQSESVSVEQPTGQQPSLSMQWIVGSFEQRAVQASGVPIIRSVEQASPSSQLFGQAPTPDSMPGSHCSPSSRRPLPQVEVLGGSGSEQPASAPATSRPRTSGNARCIEFSRGQVQR